jgi:hypothetical protein
LDSRLGEIKIEHTLAPHPDRFPGLAMCHQKMIAQAGIAAQVAYCCGLAMISELPGIRPLVEEGLLTLTSLEFRIAGS